MNLDTMVETKKNHLQQGEGQGSPEDVDTEAYNTSDVVEETDGERQPTSEGGQTGEEDGLCGEVQGGDQLQLLDRVCPGDPLHLAVPHGEQSSSGELREGDDHQEEGGESEFEEGVFGPESPETDEASADSLSLRLVEGAAADMALEAMVLNDREDDSNKHAEDTVRMKNYRWISLMARTLIKGYKKGDFQEFGHDYLMRALRHMRLWQRINSSLPLFIEDLLNRLSDGTEATRDMVLNLDRQLGPATFLSFDSEAAYWGVLTDDEIDPETPRRRRERYMSSSVSEVSDPDYWVKTRYETGDEETEVQQEMDEEEYEPSIAPGPPEEVPEEQHPEEEHGGEGAHGDGDQAQRGDGGVLLPLEEEINLWGCR